MLSATVMDYEISEAVPAIDRKICEPCTICLGESGVAFPTRHECESHAGTDKTMGFVTFSSFDLNQVYKGLRP